jgi:hypothetical protein
MAKKRLPLRRYSAALLFQYRVVADRSSGKRRLCEEQIIHFRANDARSASEHAKKRGHEGEGCYKNNNGNMVHFEFVGVRELIGCDAACEPDEVWYHIVEMLRPMERRKQLIPSEAELSAIRNDD